MHTNNPQPNYNTVADTVYISYYNMLKNPLVTYQLGMINFTILKKFTQNNRSTLFKYIFWQECVCKMEEIRWEYTIWSFWAISCPLGTFGSQSLQARRIYTCCSWWSWNCGCCAFPACFLYVFNLFIFLIFLIIQWLSLKLMLNWLEMQ